MPEATVLQTKKKNKSAAGKPQPAWLFQSDEENPVLKRNEVEERLKAINFLKHKAKGASQKAGPPSQLMQLVGVFLSSYGFSSTSRLFAIERKARKKAYVGDDEVEEKKFAKGEPTLDKIYNDWLATTILKEEATNSSSSETKSSGDEAEETSSDASSSDSSRKAKRKKRLISKQAKGKPNGKAAAGSSSSSSSDTDADDEHDEETATSRNADKPKINEIIDKLELKAAQTTESRSRTAVTKAKMLNGAAVSTHALSMPQPDASTANKLGATTADDTSSESSSVESSEDEAIGQAAGVAVSQIQVATAKHRKSAQPRESAAHRPKQHPTANSSESESDTGSSSASSGVAIEKKAEPVPKKRKHVDSPKVIEAEETAKRLKNNNIPFQRVPADTQVDPKLSSNAYRSYDYADRAYQDLSVTKGKGFTKEKNKKKRGSYRGGMIDISGGKGIKFED